MNKLNKNGYTMIELLVLIVVLGVIAVITIPKMSYAFYDEKDELYNSDINLYLKQATEYGNSIKEDIKSSESYVITIRDLVDKGYIGALSGDITDVRDGSSMMDMKILLTYDEASDEVKASLAA